MAAIVHTRMSRLYAGPRTVSGTTGGGLLQTTVTASLSIETCTLPADSSGNVTSYAAAVTTMTVREGGVDTTAKWSFSRTNGDGISSSLSSNTLTISNLTADSGYVDITATRAGYDPIQKRFALSRAKAGAAGTSTPGSPGVRGTIVTKISGSWSDSTANSQIYSVAVSAGATPTTPIKGDIVYYTGGAKEYTGSSWASVAAYIDGSLVVSGTIAADNIAAGTMTGSTVRTSSGSTRVELSALDNSIKAYSGGTAYLTLSASSSGYISIQAGSNPGLYITGSGANIVSESTVGSGIIGRATGGGSGVVGTSTSASGYGVQAGNSAGGIGLYLDNKFQWGSYTIVAPGGLSNQYLAANGTWKFLASSDITNALGYTPVSSSGSVSYATSSGSSSSATYSTYVSNSSGAYLQTGSYKATMQTDGNFVVYGVSTWGAGTNVSDRRQKSNIRPTKEAGLPMIDKLRVVDFEWKKKSRMWDGGKRHTGFIAQEVGALIPDAMTETDGLCFLHKEEIVPYLVKAVQELAEEVRTLRAQLH